LRQSVEAAAVGARRIAPAVQHRQEGMLAVAEGECGGTRSGGEEDARRLEYARPEEDARGVQRLASLEVERHAGTVLREAGDDGAGAVAEDRFFPKARDLVPGGPDQPVGAAVQAEAAAVAARVDGLPCRAGGKPPGCQPLAGGG